jgi:hypothetical protein
VILVEEGDRTCHLLELQIESCEIIFYFLFFFM